MTVEIVGARDYDMVGESGERIRGVSLYMLYPENGVVGRMAEKRSYANGNASQFLIPGMYNIEFTPKGRISSITEIKPDGKH